MQLTSMSILTLSSWLPVFYQERPEGPYTKRLLPTSYRPPRQRNDEHKQKHKESDHAVVQDLLSPSKKRKGSVTSVTAASRETSPSRVSHTKAAAAQQKELKTPSREMPVRSAKQGMLSTCAASLQRDASAVRYAHTS